MNLPDLLKTKDFKPKEKTEIICNLLIEQRLTLQDLLETAREAKDPEKATCIESLEFATKNKPEIATPEVLHFVTKTLLAKAPRVKWESAKVIGNIAGLFSDQLDEAITNLLQNTEHSGTVVRWSAAFALGEILKLNSERNKELRTALETICNQEEKNSIKKIYQAALKKAK
jgi:hypothetical protein